MSHQGYEGLPEAVLLLLPLIFSCCVQNNQEEVKWCFLLGTDRLLGQKKSAEVFKNQKCRERMPALPITQAGQEWPIFHAQINN